MRRRLWLWSLAGALSACDDPVTPPHTGVIALQVVTAQDISVPFDSGRVHVRGDTSLLLRATPGAEVSIELREGTYSLSLEGSANDEVWGIGEKSGIRVVAGETTSENMTMASFEAPALSGLPDTTASLSFTASIGTVPMATAYRVEVADDEGFGDPLLIDATPPRVEISVPATGTYHVRVRALTGTSPGPASDPETVVVVRQFRLTVAGAGTGAGVVTSRPNGIDCHISRSESSGDCERLYEDAAGVTLTAAADNGSRFEGWSGACSGTGECAVMMTADRALTATFVRVFTLAFGTHRSGGGRVRAEPPGTECSLQGDRCTESYPEGTSVTLTALPDENWLFRSWSGDCPREASTCTLTMTQDREAIARFDPRVEPALTGVRSATGGDALSALWTPSPGRMMVRHGGVPSGSASIEGRDRLPK